MVLPRGSDEFPQLQWRRLEDVRAEVAREAEQRSLSAERNLFTEWDVEPGSPMPHGPRSLLQASEAPAGGMTAPGDMSQMNADLPNVEREGASGAEINLKGNYSIEYANKLQSTYKKLRTKGYQLSEHSLNRIQGRISQGKIDSIDHVINTVEKGTKYTDTVSGGTVIFKDGISVHIAEDGTIKTVIGNAKVKSTWEVY